MRKLNLLNTIRKLKDLYWIEKKKTNNVIKVSRKYVKNILMEIENLVMEDTNMMGDGFL